MKKENEIVKKKLTDFFPENDLEWRISRSGEKNGRVWATCLVYISNRAIMKRLDEVVGSTNWKNEFKEWHNGAQLCGISIYDSVKKEWITKWDGADNTAFEGTKGGLSGAMKRAGYQWGIGRYLYQLTEQFANIVQSGGRYQGKNNKKNIPAFNWLPPRMDNKYLPVGFNYKLNKNDIDVDPVKTEKPKSNKTPPVDDWESDKEYIELVKLMNDGEIPSEEIVSAMKRAGYQWGIGNCIYVDPVKTEKPKSNKTPPVDDWESDKEYIELVKLMNDGEIPSEEIVSAMKKDYEASYYKDIPKIQRPIFLRNIKIRIENKKKAACRKVAKEIETVSPEKSDTKLFEILKLVTGKKITIEKVIELSLCIMQAPG